MEVAPPLLRWEGCISRGQHCPTIPPPLSDGWNVRPWVEISTLNIALVPKDADGAVRWLTASAEQGNQYAQYALGKLFLLGKDVPEDRKAARQWFQKAAEQGDQYAQYFVERMDHRDLFPVVQSAARLLHHLAGIFREQSQPPHPRGLRLTVDKKLWRKIREKKIAMGHKPDDHEEPTITM